MGQLDKLIASFNCGIYRPVKPAKYRVRNKQRQRLHRCIGCGKSKWYDVDKHGHNTPPKE